MDLIKHALIVNDGFVYDLAIGLTYDCTIEALRKASSAVIITLRK